MPFSYPSGQAEVPVNGDVRRCGAVLTGTAGKPVSVPCHFGEWLQGRLGDDGPLALVTLIPDATHLSATRKPGPRRGCHAIGHGAFDAGVLSRFDRALGLGSAGQVLARLPFAPGLGTGMSTATLVAIARLRGFNGPARALAQACIAAEGASDPLMFPDPDRLLWASREGRVLGQMPIVPRAHLLGGFFGPPRPTQPADTDYDDVSDLVARWALARGLTEFAELASESARRCLFRRGPADDPTPGLARQMGALGWVASHSGAARALIFRPGQVPADGADRMRAAGLRGILHFATGKV